MLMLGDHIGALARAWRWRSWAGARRDRARPARDVGLREVTRSHPSYACDDQPARIAGVKTATGRRVAQIGAVVRGAAYSDLRFQGERRQRGVEAAVRDLQGCGRHAVVVGALPCRITSLPS